jgi:monoamine oxidase
MLFVARILLAVLLACAPASGQFLRPIAVPETRAVSVAPMTSAAVVPPPALLTALPLAAAPAAHLAAAPAAVAAPAPAPLLAAPAAAPVRVLRAAADPSVPARAVFDGTSAPRIAVIGGGLSGLAAVHELSKLGFSAELYEAEPRLGGRARSSAHAATGLTVDEGAEFVSSTHDALLGLMKGFGVKTIARRSVARRRTYFYQGEPVDERKFQLRLFKEAGPQLRALKRDEREIRRAVAERRMDVLERYDSATLGEYLDRIQAPAILRSYVESVVESESGRDYRGLSAVVLFECLSVDLKARRIAVLPDEDEVFKIAGGAGAIVAALEARHGGAIRREHRLTALKSDDGRNFQLEFRTPEGPKTIRADYVVMALPQPALKSVAIETPGWTDASRRAVASVEFGAHLKLTLFFARRIWEKLKHSGGGFNDSGFVFWDSSEGQRGPRGSITFLGRASAVTAEAGDGRPKAGELAWKFLDQLSRAFPGLRAKYLGYKLTAWPHSYPFADVPGHPYGYTLTYLNRRGPGKLSSEPMGNLFWAGDFFSANSPAYMNGAVESGIAAVRAIARRILGR